MRMVSLKVFLLLLACLALNISVSAAKEPASVKDGPDGPAIGDIVTFGRYEQDNDETNGPEPIEWIVLDVHDGKAFLLSRYGLDAMPYEQERKNITWEKCTLRGWLNEDFFNTAFSAEEQAAVVLSDVGNSAADGYFGYTTYGGQDTKDHVFLLSYAQVNEYLWLRTPEEDRSIAMRVSPTLYAQRKGAFVDSRYLTSDGKNAGWWWLRSPGILQEETARIGLAGSLDSFKANNTKGTVRPAIWLNPAADPE